MLWGVWTSVEAPAPQTGMAVFTIHVFTSVSIHVWFRVWSPSTVSWPACMMDECASEGGSACEFMPLNTLTVGSFIVHRLRHRARTNPSLFSPQYSQEPEPSYSSSLLIKASHSVPSWMRPVGALIILPKKLIRDQTYLVNTTQPHTSQEVCRQVELPHRIVFGSGAAPHTEPSLSGGWVESGVCSEAVMM